MKNIFGISAKMIANSSATVFAKLTYIYGTLFHLLYKEICYSVNSFTSIFIGNFMGNFMNAYIEVL